MIYAACDSCGDTASLENHETGWKWVTLSDHGAVSPGNGRLTRLLCVACAANLVAFTTPPVRRSLRRRKP